VLNPAPPSAWSFYPAFRVWSPSRSRVRIEYPPALLRNLTPGGDEADSFGTLYGERTSRALRVLAIRPEAGLEPVGIFATRIRGEVFLTEQDLERFEALEDSRAIALVIAGSTGGFFVRETDGSMQTIKSYQEFPIYPPAPKIIRAPKAWVPVVSQVVLPLAVAAAAILVWPSRAFTLHEQDGQLQIVLRQVKPGARLEIVDGSTHRSLPITPSLSSVVYTPHTRNVRIAVVR